MRAAARWVLGFFIEILPLATIVILFLAMASPEPPYCVPSAVSPIASLQELPRELRHKLTSHLPDMVDRGEPFEATDVGSGPRRRFIIAAATESRWVMAYEHGGIGYHIHVLAFDWPTQHESPSLISNRMSFPDRFCNEINMRLRNEPIPADRANAQNWNY
jgi:hypothetical protein